MQALAFVAGPVVWLVGMVVAVMAFAYMYGLNTDGYIPLMITVYLGSLSGAFGAFVSMRRLRPSTGERTAYIVIAVFALLWLGPAVVEAVGTDNLFYRLAALAAAQAAIFMAWRLKA
jgi:hypothetical protein